MPARIDLPLETIYGMAWMRLEYKMSWNDIGREYGVTTQFVITTAQRYGWFIKGEVFKGRGQWGRDRETGGSKRFGNENLWKLNAPYSDAERANQERFARNAGRFKCSIC